MRQYTWERQRKDIQRGINSFFARDIHIMPRAMAALQAGDNPGWESFDARAYGMKKEDFRGVYEDGVLDSLLRCSPACVALLAASGVRVEDLVFEAPTNRPAPLADDTLGWLFRGVEWHPPFSHEYLDIVPSAQIVKDRGI